MAYRTTPFANQNFYHIYNRGVEKRNIFSNDKDYQRFLQTLHYYQFTGPKPPFSRKDLLINKKSDFSRNPKSVEIICYCLMPNHFHLLLRQVQEGGIQKFIQQALNSYTKYFNIKHDRIGPLLQGAFKAVSIETDEQLVHVSRYIHLNPFVANLTQDLKNFLYSSYPAYVGLADQSFCCTKPVLDFFKNPDGYKKFVADHSGYAKELGLIKHLLLNDN